MIRFRAAPLRAAAIFAAAFVVVRVVYRGLFNGLGGAGAPLLDLPPFRLPDPVDHVVLLGPVTSQGLTTAVLGALPIAGIILGLGVVNALVDVPALCARASRGGPLRSVAQALVIAWATFPALVRSVGDVRRARALRGRRGLASLLVPVMERTVERAVALGASMEVRGFASDRRSSPSSPPPAGEPAVVLGGLRLDHGGSFHLAADLELPQAALVLLTGPTGAGKSTLLRALSGLHQHVDDGGASGELRVLGRDRALPPHRTAALVGVVPQHPRLSFVAETVLAEIAFAGQVQGLPDAEARASAVAADLGLTPLLAATPADLSAGESQLVALAAAVTHGPRLLLVDEPLADLDAPARDRVVSTLRRLARRDGLCVLVAEHRTASLLGIADLVLEVVPDDADGDGARVRIRLPAPAGPVEPADLARPTAPSSSSPVLAVSGISVAFGERPVLRAVALEVAPGEILAVTGDVGTGKSTLLNAIALPDPGTVTVAGGDLARLDRRTRHLTLALVPDASDDLLFRLTVAQECATADRDAGRPAGSTSETFLGFLALGSLAATTLLASHPRDLSVGQRRLLVLALQLAARPRVLLVDEPSRGLDPRAGAAVRLALESTARSGTAVLLATHDAAFLALADRVVALRDGALHPARPGGIA